MTANIEDAIVRANAMGGGLRIVGGDVNYKDRKSGEWQDWWLHAQEELAYTDVIFDHCGGGSACLDENWTIENSSGDRYRLDFLFAQRNGMSTPITAVSRTISFEQASMVNPDSAGLPYSDHRGIRTFFYYE